MEAVETIRNLISSQLETTVSIHEVSNGFEEFQQQNLPGERTVVLEINGMFEGRNNMFFAVSNNTVFIPKMLSRNEMSRKNVTPNIVNVLENNGYDTEVKEILSRHQF